MTHNDGYWKFTNSISKFVKARNENGRVSNTSLKSTKRLDELLEEEYETLLKEIDYLTSEKSCYLSFKNEQFSRCKSSQDLAQILNKHSEEVLKTYIEKHDKFPRKTSLKTQADLVNYVTKIVVSRPKCNHKLCTCKPVTASKEVLTEPRFSKDSGQATQTTYSSHKSTETRPQRPRIIIRKEDKPAQQATSEIQTEPWSHDPNCTCGCCPKRTGSQITSRSIATDDKKLQHASTSDKRVTASKYILANCAGETIETQTQKKLCAPENFEGLLRNDEDIQFSPCSAKQDCGCDAFDAKEALKRGLVLPSAEICVQSKKIQAGKEKSGKRRKQLQSSTSVSSVTSSSDNKVQPETKSKAKKTGKPPIIKRTVPSEEFASSTSTPRRNEQKHKRKTTGCFGSKTKRKQCDEYCQGIAGKQQSVQTMPIKTKDKSEHIQFYEDRTSTHTSTDSEAAVQVSPRPSREYSLKSRADKGVSLREEKEAGPSFEGPTKTQKSRDKDENKCNKCGRKRRNCDNACRNTIIIPYATGSNGGIPAGEAESLRMLIKMQSKDTSRQFDGILAELNHHKGEIKRLNSMYQKMVENVQDSQKSGSKSKKSSDISHECGCSYSNECRTERAAGRSADQSLDQCMCKNSNGTNNEPSRRFGPPNTAVAINMCDTCTVKISPTACGSRDQDYFDGDKQRKNEINRSKKANQNIQPSTDFRERGDLYGLSNQNSLSSIYNRDNKQDSNIRKKEGHFDLLNGRENDDEEDDLVEIPRLKVKSDEDDIKPKRLHSSRVLIWLKKSWITIRHKTEECRRKEKERQEKSKMTQVLNFCHSSAKKVAANMWKSMKSSGA